VVRSVKAAIGILLVVLLMTALLMAPAKLCEWDPDLQGSELVEGVRGATPGALSAALIAVVGIVLVVIKGEPPDDEPA
jgi:hypothetical protein